MLRPELKKPLNDQVQDYLAAGGQIRFATNTGIVTVGQHSDKARARGNGSNVQRKPKRLRSVKTKDYSRPMTTEEKSLHQSWNIHNQREIARMDAFADQYGCVGHAVLDMAEHK